MHTLTWRQGHVPASLLGGLSFQLGSSDQAGLFPFGQRHGEISLQWRELYWDREEMCG